MHYYQFNIGDYVSSTHHLDEMEDLAYRRMLDLYYSKELPLPSDPKEIARLIRMRSHVECIESVLLEFFELTKDGYRNHGADKVLNNAYDKSEKARLAAKARWDRKNKDLDKESSNADAMQTHSERNATHNPLPITHNPVNTTSTKADHINYQAIQKTFNSTLTKAAKIVKMTDKRKRLVKRFFKDFDLDMDKWVNYLSYINNSPDCDWMFEVRDRGNGQQWQPKGFEFIVSESCYLKVKEQYS